MPRIAERALLTVLRGCWNSAGKCRVTIINSMRVRASTHKGPPHQVLVDWSLVELILAAETCARLSLPADRDRFFKQIKCLFFKVLAWRMAAEGEQVLSRYFLERYREALPSAFTARERRRLERGRYPGWKVALVLRFLVEHEFMHAAFFEDGTGVKDIVEKNAARTCARLERAGPFPAHEYVSSASGDCDARSWEKFVRCLSRDDPGFAEEIMADQFAFDQIVGRWRWRGAAQIGRLIGCIFGVSILIEELTADANPATLFPWRRTGDFDAERAEDELVRLARISDRWRFRANEGLRATLIMRLEQAAPAASIAALAAFLLHKRRSLARMMEAYREAAHTVRHFDGALAFVVESPAIQPYSDPALLDLIRREVPASEWIALRERLAAL